MDALGHRTASSFPFLYSSCQCNNYKGVAVVPPISVAEGGGRYHILGGGVVAIEKGPVKGILGGAVGMKKGLACRILGIGMESSTSQSF